MADDVRAGVVAGRDEAVAEVLGVGPADYDGSWVVVLEGGVVAFVVDARGYDALDVAVGGDGGYEGAEKGCGLKDRHGDAGEILLVFEVLYAGRGGT